MIRDQLRLTGYRLGSGPVTRGHRGSIYTPRVQYIEIFQKAIDKEIGQIVSDMTNRPMAVQITAEKSLSLASVQMDDFRVCRWL